ncbi:MAG: tRNA preQ1(34) S-adenosylmethionine ribosyltransferase-isomerase QueA [Marinicaulis sp.]|nr:tRNA preQ1(34) S-adenosylmethionine ribosyltransferase-isomerase QueA [Marinicaulis sp.]
MRVDDFDFHLPEERIALEPASPRDAARMLHIRGDARTDAAIRDLPDLLNPGDLLVLNDTKVIPAQLFGSRQARSGGGDVAIDVTLHKFVEQPTRDLIRWRAFVRPAKRVRPGDVIDFGPILHAKVETRDGAECLLRFDRERGEFDAALAEYGVAPLPPYIARKRAANAGDLDDYQTVYAKESGSVAAPTAGLHFTGELLALLRERGIGFETITLHVGAGTFLPVSVDDTKDHVMHSEWGEITEEQAARINRTRENGGRIVAVGTTSLRLLESASDENGVRPFAQETDIFITPGYKFETADILLTNFHLPRSTLFMLVCAFSGTDAMKAAYAHAIENNYRFYSYGDACLLERLK